MQTVIAILITIGLPVIFLTPIVKNCIRAEKLDDSEWFYDKKFFERADKEVNSKDKIDE